MPKLAGETMLATDPAEETFVNLAKEACRDWEATEDPFQPVLHRDDIVSDFLSIVGLRRCCPRFQTK
jgi:hypothetical protein